MTVTQEPFGSIAGRPVAAYTLANANGLTARLVSYGARLAGMRVPDRAGAMADIVLGCGDLDSMAAAKGYFGATVGRYANRIAQGRFTLDGQPVQLTRNERGNHLHGGGAGLDKQVWDAAVEHGRTAVTFSLVSPDGAEGYPGRLAVRSTYALTDDDRLTIAMSATSDKPTVLNLVNHAYWNAAGHGSGPVTGQMLSVAGSFITPVDDQLLATGEILSVAGSPFDFRQAKPIGQDMQAVPGAGSAGYDHNWVLDGFGPGLRPVATLYDPASGRGLSVRGTEPGVQVYTGGYFDGSVPGKDGMSYGRYAGVTFETQRFPGSPNFAHFPSARLDPGETYDHRMEIQFFTR